MRRSVIGLTLALVVGLRPVSVQSGTRVPRIGWLDSERPYSDEQRRQSPGIKQFLEGLGELGWFEGQNLVMDLQ
jgi:hypothetical protein